VPAKPDWPAFALGLDSARDRRGPTGLLSRLFSVRTGWLAGKLRPAEMNDYLSGLLVGTEFRVAWNEGWFEAGEAVDIVGSEQLGEVYRRAAEAFGLKPRLSAADSAVRGCLAIAEMAEGLVHAA
jgi:2-dehydro-3-deoxygalactonokinase